MATREEMDIVEGRRARPSRGGGLLGQVLFVVFVVYPLSTGPVAKLYSVLDDDKLPPAVVLYPYLPLNVLYENCEPVKECLDWYLRTVWKVKN